uniref:Uncharacterized protein n=1 Tax=Schizaphis graminum TaxID=13262 RepID=A0A2S2NCC0_SCHGA
MAFDRNADFWFFCFSFRVAVNRGGGGVFDGPDDKRSENVSPTTRTVDGAGNGCQVIVAGASTRSCRGVGGWRLSIGVAAGEGDTAAATCRTAVAVRTVDGVSGRRCRYRDGRGGDGMVASLRLRNARYRRRPGSIQQQ